MAITITEQPQAYPGFGLFTDDRNENVFRFESDFINTLHDFKWRVIITLRTPDQATSAIVDRVIFDSYLQYGYLNLYPILSQLNVIPPLDRESNTGSTLIKKSWIVVKIQETAPAPNSTRVVVTEWISGDTTATRLYVHKGTRANGLTAFPNFNVNIKINPNITAVGYLQPFILNIGGSERIRRTMYIGAVPNNMGNSPYNSNQGNIVGYLDLINSTYFQNWSKYTYERTALDNVLFTMEADSCVQNNIISWRNPSGFMMMYNFAHSSIKEGNIQKQRYATNISKTAITEDTKYIDLSSLYINEQVHEWLTEILKSPEVYYNGVEVIPTTSSYRLVSSKFENLINVTFRFEFAKKENSILL